MKEIEDLEKSLSQIRILVTFLKKNRYSFEEVSEICKIIDCKIVKSGKKTILLKNEIKLHEGTLMEIAEFCISRIL